MGAPTVFLSSTRRDLPLYRTAAIDAARSAGFLAVGMEDFAPSGDKYSLEKCLEYVDKADVLVVLVAQRYGSTPDTESKSFTWLECLHARDARNIEVIALVVKEDDDTWQWPPRLCDYYRLRSEPPDLVNRDIEQLKAFKQWLSRYPTVEFATTDNVNHQVYKALKEWKERNPEFGPPPPGNPSDYLNKLRESTRNIKIEGIQIAGHPTQQFEIRQIYIPLTTAWSKDTRGDAIEHQREVPLQKALAERRLLIVGDPGSGKTTFLRRVAFEMCQSGPAAAAFLGFQDASFPILISVFELDKHINSHVNHRAAPDNPTWLLDFLRQQALDHNWKLDERFWRQKLQNGPCRVLLDGLDEAPGTAARGNMVRLIEQAAIDYPKCHFVITTRPVTEAVLNGFETVRLADLSDDAIHAFLNEWSRALYEREPDKAATFRDRLKLAIGSRKDIRDLAKNPVMLTALAVLQANNRELPQHRVELYEEILKWLAKARESKPGRVKAERCLDLLQKLAFAMQADSGGRKRQAGKGWAADQLLAEFQSPQQAGEFLEKEQTDSGIIISRGAEVQFWHLTFLEYLAARQIAAFGEARQQESVITGGNLYKPEWREVMRLLGGVLMYRQGREKVDGLFKAILDQPGKKPKLPAQAQCAALLGAMMRDLERMDYKKPEDPRYEQTLLAMESLFDPVQSAAIDINTRIEAAEALGQVGDPRLERDNWIKIEKGHGLEIGRYPVTVQEYAKFMDEGGYENEEYWHATGGFGKFKEPRKWEDQQSHGNRPVTGVSWWEAAAYCKSVGGRLPAEAEWERAARGTRKGATYPWGDDPIDETRANYNQHVGRPTPVGLYPLGATTEGVDDMLGNVWEWCSDWSDESEVRKVLRGGSWFYDRFDVRVSVRGRG